MDIDVKVATAAGLTHINSVIEAAVSHWPLAARVKRLALPSLLYDESDFQFLKVFVATQDSTVVGMASIDSSKNYAQLHALYVHPDYQGIGIGKRLMTAAFAHAAELGFEEILVKAERVAASYFEQQGLTRMIVSDDEYPYQFKAHLSEDAHQTASQVQGVNQAI
jgi:N-acetylglutamate synthase-like GNAT family acetyltransferase